MSAQAPAATPLRRSRFRPSRVRVLRERAIEFVLFLAALVSVFTTVGIVYILVKESVVFFQHVPIQDFLTDRQWTPLFDDAHFGILVLLSGTATSSAVALAVAIPMGTIIAIYLSEFAPYRLRETVKPVLEMLGGVPTIVYGYFALLFVTPLLQRLIPGLPGFNLLSAGLVMGIMIQGTVVIVMEVVSSIHTQMLPLSAATLFPIFLMVTIAEQEEAFVTTILKLIFPTAAL